MYFSIFFFLACRKELCVMTLCQLFTRVEVEVRVIFVLRFSNQEIYTLI